MPDKCYILNRLETHHGHQFFLFLPAKENHALDLTMKCFLRHVGLVIAVVGDNAFVGRRCLIYDLPNNIHVFRGKFYDSH